MRHSAIVSALALRAGISALALCAAGANGQTISGGPISGAVFDAATHSIRSIMGVPGAAYLGGASATAWDLAAPSPDGKRALALQGTDLNFISDLSQPDTAAGLGQVIQTVDRIAWSADSRTAALYSTRSGQLQRITGLGSAPAIQDPMNLTAMGPVSGWAISPDGATIAYSTPAGSGGNVFLIAGSAAPLSLASFGDPGALVFSGDGSSLFVFDKAKDQIVKIQVSSGSVLDAFPATPASAAIPAPAVSTAAKSQVRPVRRAPRVVAPGIVDMAASSDGNTLLAAKNGMLCAYDLTRQSPDRCQTLDMSPSSVEAISPGMFVLNYPRTSGLPMWLWDGAAGATYFIPSGRTAANGAN